MIEKVQNQGDYIRTEYTVRRVQDSLDNKPFATRVSMRTGFYAYRVDRIAAIALEKAFQLGKEGVAIKMEKTPTLSTTCFIVENVGDALFEDSHTLLSTPRTFGYIDTPNGVFDIQAVAFLYKFYDKGTGSLLKIPDVGKREEYMLSVRVDRLSLTNNAT